MRRLRVATRLRPWLRQLGRVPAAQAALRALLLVSGAAAMLIAPGGRLVLPGLLTLIAVPGLLVAVVRPDGAGPAVVLGAAAAAWTIRYGSSTPPLDATLAVAAALVIHHSTAALCAAIPPTSRIEPLVLLRWVGRLALWIAVAGAVALAVALPGRPAASTPLEFAGIAAAVVVVAVPVLLATGARPRGRAYDARARPDRWRAEGSK